MGFSYRMLGRNLLLLLLMPYQWGVATAKPQFPPPPPPGASRCTYEWVNGHWSTACSGIPQSHPPPPPLESAPDYETQPPPPIIVDPPGVIGGGPQKPQCTYGRIHGRMRFLCHVAKIEPPPIEPPPLIVDPPGFIGEDPPPPGVIGKDDSYPC